MKIDYSLAEKQTNDRGVFLTYRKLGTPNHWWEKLFGMKQTVELIKVFYPVTEHGHSMQTSLSYSPSGISVPTHLWTIFMNLLDMKEAEDKPKVVEKIYTREPLRCKEGWVNPNKGKDVE